MFYLIQKGGPIMWPLILTSVVALTVVLERIFFVIEISLKRSPKTVEAILDNVERGDVEAAIEAGQDSGDYVVRVLISGLKQYKLSLSNALISASNRVLKRFNQGLSVLDTTITLAPLLGLLSTVIGMIRAFGLLGGRELDSPTVITGGIAEALIGTAFGLGIAVMALIPFNYLNTRLEDARHELEDTANHLELLLKSQGRI